MQLEAVVRPYSSPDPINRSVIVTQVARVPLAYATATWGDVGPLPAPSTGGVMTLNCADKYKQDNVKWGDSIRIENPSDSSQYIMWQQVETTKFNHQNKDEFTISYQKTQRLYGIPHFTGPNQPFINVLANSQQICEAEYDFQSIAAGGSTG
jgi:hypothetical protein